MRRLAFALPFALLACSEQPRDAPAHTTTIPEFDADVGASDVDANEADTPSSTTTCTAPPRFDAPILLPYPTKPGFGVANAQLVALDDDRVLVVAEIPQGAVFDLTSTVIDLRTRNVAPWKSIATNARPGAVSDLGGRVAVSWANEAGGGDVAIVSASDVSSPLSKGTGAFTGAWTAPLGATGALAFWPGSVAILRGHDWSPPIVLGDAAPLSQFVPLDDGSTELVVQEIATGLGQSSRAFRVDASGAWSSTTRSRIDVTDQRTLTDGTILVALAVPRGDGTSEIWTTDARPPRDWSKPTRTTLADGSPIRVETAAGSYDPMLFPIEGTNAAELVVWNADCVDGVCTHRPITRRFEEGAWGDAVDRSWGTDPNVDPHRVYSAAYGTTPIFARGGAFRIRLADEWQDPMGESEVSLQDVAAVTPTGFWLASTTFDKTPAFLLYVDTHGHASARHEIGGAFGGGVVDASGAFVALGDQGIYRFADPMGDPEIVPRVLPDETSGAIVNGIESARAPKSEVFVVQGQTGETTRLHLVAWNAAGRSNQDVEGAAPRTLDVVWRGCGGAVLYGEQSADAGTGVSTLVLVPVR